MKGIKLFYLTHCPYCIQARKVIDDLISADSKYGDIEIEWIEESQHPDIADQYDYYYVPTIFIGNEKVYEAHRGEQYSECYEHVKRAVDRVLEG